MKQASKGTFYWDASIVLMILGGEECHGEGVLDSAIEIVRWMEQGDAVIITSETTKAEVLPSKAKSIADYDRYQEWLQRRNMLIRGVDSGVMARTVELRDRCIRKGVKCLKTCDAIHLATALLYEQQITEVHSVDPHFESAIRRSGEKLKVVKPFVPKPEPPTPPAQLALEIPQGILISVPRIVPELPIAGADGTDGGQRGIQPVQEPGEVDGVESEEQTRLTRGEPKAFIVPDEVRPKAEGEPGT